MHKNQKQGEKKETAVTMKKKRLQRTPFPKSQQKTQKKTIDNLTKKPQTEKEGERGHIP